MGALVYLLCLCMRQQQWLHCLLGHVGGPGGEGGGVCAYVLVSERACMRVRALVLVLAGCTLGVLVLVLAGCTLGVPVLAGCTLTVGRMARILVSFVQLYRRIEALLRGRLYSLPQSCSRVQVIFSGSLSSPPGVAAETHLREGVSRVPWTCGASAQIMLAGCANGGAEGTVLAHVQ